MRNPQIKLMDLVLGLERFGDRYEAIDVFVDDLLEARSAALVPGLSALGSEGTRFRFTVPEGKAHAGQAYDLQVAPETGVLRMSRATPAPGEIEAPAPPGLTGPSVGRAIAAAQSTRGGAAADELVLGLLAGGFLGHDRSQDAPRRVFTMRFDAASGQWRAYDGGLVPWMKEHLLPRSA